MVAKVLDGDILFLEGDDCAFDNGLLSSLYVSR